nr:adenylate/guanylate cyclase domain-containing protein [Kofleriaceae bacterium]
MTHPALSPELVRDAYALSVEADELIGACVRDRLSLRAVMARFLPALEGWLGAKGALVTTRNEQLVDETFTWGQWRVLGGADLHDAPDRLVVDGSGTSLWRALRVAGADVGRIALLLDGDRSHDAARVHALLDAAVRELDVVLATTQTAAHKQRVIVEVEELLTDPVFDRGVDRAVAALHRAIRVPDVALCYRDEVERGGFRYRVYHDGELRFASDGPAPRHDTLAAALAGGGDSVVTPDSKLLRLATGLPNGVETVLSTGMMRAHWLGKVVCSAGDHGFSAFALDVVEVMCEAISQRLVDFNRERRHLAQFFSGRTITELLQDPGYEKRYLSPREHTIAVLYADINSFTKISEQVLEHPPAIATFVDDWSAGTVGLLWKHGGVFDKMVGDCVIGLFGPPFFRDTPEQRAVAAMAAAREILAFTVDMEKRAPYDRIPRSGIVPGLGVAIGVNLCPMSVGLMGPNQDYTGFSSGMNNTARLQSLAGFRETLAMDTAVDAIERAGAAAELGVTFGEPQETAVKNVKHPLRYRRVTFAG